MPVPSDLTSFSTTAGSNYPTGGEAVGSSLDNYLRSIQAVTKMIVSKGTNITAASSVTIPDDGNFFIVSGTTTITSFANSWTGRIVTLSFSGASGQLTHSASLICPNSANIVLAAGDVVQLVYESTGVWRVTSVLDASVVIPTATASTLVGWDSGGTYLQNYAAGTLYIGPGSASTSGLTMAEGRLLGRTSTSTGAIEEISVGTGLALTAGNLALTGASYSFPPDWGFITETPPIASYDFGSVV